MGNPTCYKSTYAEKLQDPRWQKKRLEVLERDEWKCRDCGDDNKSLHVHNCLYEKGDPWDTDSKFLMALCADCHESRGMLESDAKRALAIILSRTLQGDRGYLLESVSSIIHAAQCDGEELWMMMDVYQAEYNVNIRWHKRAIKCKSMRPHYEAVTGKKISWGDFK